ncbi:3-hydroxyacyl-ACP dehydratase [Sphingobacterium shayense]|nr:3-hydroxyacyl-ACP dehydratase [Sphingobacterium shayense]
MLKEFYTIENIIEHDVQSYDVQIRLNPKHDIFKGHFPNNPVTPGVCMMQIIKDLSEHVTGKQLFLTKSSNVKFMALINPDQNPLLNLNLSIEADEQYGLKVKNVTSFDQTVALKLTNIYKIIIS